MATPTASVEIIEDLVLFGVDQEGIWTNDKKQKKMSSRNPSPDSGRSSLSSSDKEDSSSDEEPTRNAATMKSKFLHLFKKTAPQKIQTERKGGDFVFKNERDFFFNEKARNVPAGLGSTRPEDWVHPFYSKKKKDIKESKLEEEQPQVQTSHQKEEQGLQHQPQVQFNPMPPSMSSSFIPYPPLPPPVPLMSLPVPPPSQYFNIPPPHYHPFYPPLHVPIYPPMHPFIMVPYPQYPPPPNPYYFY